MFTHRNPEALGGGEFFARVVFRIIHHGLSPRKERLENPAESSKKLNMFDND